VFVLVLLQSSRHVFYLVLESIEVDTLYIVAQLSLADPESDPIPVASPSNRFVLLQFARIHGQKDDWSVVLLLCLTVRRVGGFSV
jgi:hypothetical protein